MTSIPSPSRRTLVAFSGVVAALLTLASTVDTTAAATTYGYCRPPSNPPALLSVSNPERWRIAVETIPVPWPTANLGRERQLQGLIADGSTRIAYIRCLSTS